MKERWSGRCDTCSDLVDFRVNPVWSNADIFFLIFPYGIQIQVHFHVGHFLAKGNQQLLVPICFRNKSSTHTDYSSTVYSILNDICQIWPEAFCSGGEVLCVVTPRAPQAPSRHAGWPSSDLNRSHSLPSLTYNACFQYGFVRIFWSCSSRPVTWTIWEAANSWNNLPQFPIFYTATVCSVKRLRPVRQSETRNFWSGPATFYTFLYKLMFKFLKILIRTGNFFSLVLNTGRLSIKWQAPWQFAGRQCILNDDCQIWFKAFASIVSCDSCRLSAAAPDAMVKDSTGGPEIWWIITRVKADSTWFESTAPAKYCVPWMLILCGVTNAAWRHTCLCAILNIALITSLHKWTLERQTCLTFSANVWCWIVKKLSYFNHFSS